MKFKCERFTAAVLSLRLNLQLAVSLSELNPYSCLHLLCLLLHTHTHTHTHTHSSPVQPWQRGCGFSCRLLNRNKTSSFQVVPRLCWAFVEFSKTVPGSAVFPPRRGGGGGVEGGLAEGGREPALSGGSSSHLPAVLIRLPPCSAPVVRHSHSQPPLGTPLPAH